MDGVHTINNGTGFMPSNVIKLLKSKPFESFVLLRDHVEIIDYEGDFSVFHDRFTNLILAISDNLMLGYELTKPQLEIETKHREEILEYCLGSYTDEDTVSLGDIFIHGKYIKQILSVNGQTESKP